MDEQDINGDNNKNAQKIQALRDMIASAETTLQGAKSMLLQLEGKKKVGRKRKLEETDDHKVIEGTFDGQIMIGTDGKQYPVPANYASKSKLIEGDMLKLSITSDGSFIYKQIGPVTRKMSIGTINQDADGNYFVTTEGKAYRVLLASITYFKVEPGDEVTLVTPRDIDSQWGAIENVLQKSGERKIPEKFSETKTIDDIFNEKPNYNKTASTPTDRSIANEWTPDLEELKKELEDNNNE